MICCACRETTLGAPCSSCGLEPRPGGRYRLEALVGRGAAGSVFRGLVEATGAVVAIKDTPIVHPDPKIAELTAREVRVLQQLDHPAIPKAIEAIVQGGRLFFVQDFVRGQTLREELAEQRYDEDRVLAIVEELLGVLAYLHQRQPPVIHRDLKPGNVLRRPDGSLALVDFGAVRDVLRDPELGGSTVAGTFGYMAPEQMQGDARPATDIYGLGALAVALLSRRDPGPLMDWSGRFRWKEAISVHPAVEALLEGMLQPDPSQRRGDAAQLRIELQELRRQLREGTAMVPAPAPATAPATQISMVALGAALVLMLVAGVAGFLLTASEAPPASSEVGEWHPPAIVEAIPAQAEEGSPQMVIEDGALVEVLDEEGVLRCVYDSARAVSQTLQAYDAAFDTYVTDLEELGYQQDAACARWVEVRVELVQDGPYDSAEAHLRVLRGSLEGQRYVGSLDGEVRVLEP